MASSLRGDRVRALLRALIDLHRAPRAELRLAVWGFWICLLVLALRAGPVRGAALVTWISFNTVLLLVAVCWGVFHVKAMWRAQSTALSWAFAVAAVLSLSLGAAVEQAAGFGGTDGARIRALVMLSVFLGHVTICFPLSFCGASLGALTRRPDEAADTAAGRGVVAWWVALAVLVGGAALAHTLLAGPPDGSDLPRIAYAMSWPGLAAVLTRILWRRRAELRALRKRAGVLMRRLQVTLQLGRHAVRLDLRGAALGGLAAVLTLAAGGVGLLRPLGSRGLGELMYAGGVLLPRYLPGLGFGPPPSTPLVTLQLDSSAQYRARTSRSEAALQAEVIRKLSAYGVRAVVLVPPLLDVPTWADPHDEADAQPESPPLGEQDFQRNAADLPKLVAAMRDAGNVFLAVPRGGLGHGAVGQLAMAAAGVGLSEFGYFGGGRLPAIDLTSAGMQPLPVVLTSALSRQPAEAQVVSTTEARLAGRSIPTVARGLALVDFGGAGPAGQFRRLDYTTVLRYETIWANAQELLLEPAGAGPVLRFASGARWVKPADYLRGRIVFLDSFVRRSQDTPLGSMPSQELLAHAVATLLAGRYISAPPSWLAGLATLLLAMLAGHLSLRRDPLPAAWRLAVLSLILIVVVVGRFFLVREWIDPVPPLVACSLAALMVVQLTLLTERDARERNRALLQRFVAPQVVDELLENPDGLGLGGKRQEVVVLFADVRGFTPFAERHTPEEVIDSINAYMTALTIALHNHGGLLDKYTGDGLMAIFRVGEHRADDLLRAVGAGLEMRDAADLLTRQFVRQGRDALDIGLAAHCGEAVVGLVGNPNQFNYTALGYTVAVAQRLEALAAGGEFLISDTLYREVADRVLAAAGGPVRVKGMSEPIRPYTVLGLQEPVTAERPESETPAIDLPL